MVNCNDAKANFRLDLIWLIDNKGNEMDYQDPGIMRELLNCANGEGFISRKRAPAWLRETSVDISRPYQRPEFPLRICQLGFLESAGSNGDLTEYEEYSWRQFADFRDKSRLM